MTCYIQGSSQATCKLVVSGWQTCCQYLVFAVTAGDADSVQELGRCIVFRRVAHTSCHCCDTSRYPRVSVHTRSARQLCLAIGLEAY